MKSRAMGQMAALLTKPAKTRDKRPPQQWRGGLSDLAALGRTGLRKQQEAYDEQSR